MGEGESIAERKPPPTRLAGLATLASARHRSREDTSRRCTAYPREHESERPYVCTTVRIGLLACQVRFQVTDLDWSSGSVGGGAILSDRAEATTASTGSWSRTASVASC
jgi:hypothetical protein